MPACCSPLPGALAQVRVDLLGAELVTLLPLTLDGVHPARVLVVVSLAEDGEELLEADHRAALLEAQPLHQPVELRRVQLPVQHRHQDPVHRVPAHGGGG